MAFDLLIKGGYLVDPANQREGCFDVGLADDIITAVETDIDPGLACQTYSAHGRLVLPGLVDTHVHLTPATRAVGFQMLARAGVTTALDCAGPVETVLEGMAKRGTGINVAVLNRLTPESSLSGPDASPDEVSRYLARSLQTGALGVKLLGGHLPLSPETTAAAIQAANDNGCYAAFHCGTTHHGSNLEGLLEALELAGSNRLQICHINAYCRGLTLGSPERESLKAIDELAARPHLVSESHLGPLNCCWSRLNAQGQPFSHVTRTCLKSGGYTADKAGLLAAARADYLRVQLTIPGEVIYLEQEQGAAYLKAQNFEAMVSFPVNNRATAFLLATAKTEAGDFAVPALSTDGGAIPRNYLLSHGLSLVGFGALSLAEFVLKTARTPACMLGLYAKGHLAPGADADLLVVDRHRRSAMLTVAGGKVIMAGGVITGRGGTLLTTPSGIHRLKAQGVKHQEIDLSRSLLYTAPHGMPRPLDRLEKALNQSVNVDRTES